MANGKCRSVSAGSGAQGGSAACRRRLSGCGLRCTGAVPRGVRTDARLSDRVLTTEEAEKLENLCTRREQREPLQYLCGIWSFLDFDLAVGPGVLCPRADTEVVAEAAANTLTGIAAPRVLDLCAGTGCLGLGVKRFCPAAQVTCVEKSPEAFVYLEKNCRCALKGQGGQTGGLAGACCL